MIAQQLGVPAAAIALIPTPVSSTIAEAQLVVDYLHAQGLKSILLVTSKTHARRAGMTFRHVAGDSVQIAVCPSPYDPFTAENWWHERGVVRRVVTEYAKLLNLSPASTAGERVPASRRPTHERVKGRRVHPCIPARRLRPRTSR